MDIKVTSTRLPEFTRVVEFNLNGSNYWFELWVTDYGFGWTMSDADGNQLNQDQQLKLFNTDEDKFSDVIDDLIAMAEDYEVDRAIEWRERIKATA